MSTRATLLAQRIEQGADALAVFAEGLSEAQWRTVVQPDGRPVGVIIHHVASVYPIEIHLATAIAGGRPITGVTWNVVAQMNAKHAQEQNAAGREDTIDLLLRNGHEAVEAVRTLTDDQLDNAAPVSLHADAPLTAQFLIEDHAARHRWHHLARIRAALQGV